MLADFLLYALNDRGQARPPLPAKRENACASTAPLPLSLRPLLPIARAPARALAAGALFRAPRRQLHYVEKLALPAKTDSIREVRAPPAARALRAARARAPGP